MATRTYIEELSNKQFIQLVKLCREFQPHEPFDEVVFLELVSAARMYCDPGEFVFMHDKQTRFSLLMIGKWVDGLKRRYYFDGIRRNGKPLDYEQLMQLAHYLPIVKAYSMGMEGLCSYRPVEKVLFVKIVRACRDFLRAGMSREAEPAFFDKLNVVYDAMKPQDIL